MHRIYLDNNATTPVLPEVFEAMRPYFGEHFGNASSIHHHGQETRAAVEDARESVAALLGCRALGDCLHQRRHRGRQSGDCGSGRSRRSRHHVEHRAPCRAAGLQASGRDRLRSDGSAGRRPQPGRSSRRAARPASEHEADLRHDGEQRDRSSAAGRRNRKDRSRSRSLFPHRRGAGCGQSCD